MITNKMIGRSIRRRAGDASDGTPAHLLRLMPPVLS
jgi:hypothetical protein